MRSQEAFQRFGIGAVCSLMTMIVMWPLTTLMTTPCKCPEIKPCEQRSYNEFMYLTTKLDRFIDAANYGPKNKRKAAQDSIKYYQTILGIEP